MKLAAIGPREASIFACFADTVVAPQGTMPAIRDTDAVAAFDAIVAASPPVNRAGLRAGLAIIELAPLAFGEGKRLRRLDRAGRLRAMRRFASGPLAGLFNALRGVAHLAYYGDLAVMRAHGYDPEAVVARGRELRRTEARW